jgi:hypothetical protein
MYLILHDYISMVPMARMLRTSIGVRAPYKRNGGTMRSQALIQETIRLGDLIVAIFDEAAHYSSDPKEVSRLATQTLMHMLRAARRTLAPLPQW